MALIAACYAGWLAAGMLYATAGWASIAALAVTIALHSSLQHEAIHGHPTPHHGLNEALVAVPTGLLVPFGRYRDLHRVHHGDSRLTDPYDDPESFYLSFCAYERLPGAARTLLRWNNMLVVRMLIGPTVSAIGFLLTESREIIRRDRKGVRCRRAWAGHAVGLVAVATLVHLVFRMPALAYGAAAYLALSLLAVRSFCEHRWAEEPGNRTVIVERSLLGWLFLNNNLHLVHHQHPSLPWYALPAVYRARREEWVAMNGGYVFRGYGSVMRAFALRPKEPVAHPARLSR